MKQDAVYTPEEVATMLKVSKQAIYKWIREGDLASVKIGRTVRIPAAAVNRLFAGADGGMDRGGHETHNGDGLNKRAPDFQLVPA